MNQHHHRTNTEAGSTLRLGDNRKLAYVDSGTQGAPVVLFLHGSGASHDGLRMLSRVTAAGGRLISPARPGIGASEPCPGRTMTDWASDVGELCNDLGIEQIALIGVSGGGAYAVAVAHALPDLVTGVGLLSCGGPLDTAIARSGLARSQRVTWFLARHRPRLLRAAMNLQAKQLAKDPTAVARRLLRSLPDVDRMALARWPDEDQTLFFVEPMAEAFARGPDAIVQDLQLLAGPWGFDPAEITVPVSLWHGTADVSAPWHTAESLSRSIPEAELNTVEGGGHLSVIVESIDEAVDTVLKPLR